MLSCHVEMIGMGRGGVMGKPIQVEFLRVYDNEYRRIVGRFVRQMEKEVTGLLGKHHNLSVGDAWDIVIKAFRQADRIVSGGYPTLS